MNRTVRARLGLQCAALALIALSVGCSKEPAAPAKPAPVSTNAAAPPVAEAKPAAQVAKLVFVGKQDACDCTRNRIDDSLAALHAALGDKLTLPIERLQVDVDEVATAPYNEMRPIMVLPAVYLLDADGKLTEMLQGEVTEEQFRNALGLPAPRPGDK